jgi:hypothetical protein
MHSSSGGGGITTCEPKVDVEKENDKVAVLLHQQRLNTSSNDPSDTSGFKAAFMASLNDHNGLAGNIEDYDRPIYP